MARRSRLDALRHSAPAILPSLLLCDFGNLEREVRALEEAGVPGLHLDVMDGQFVPNFTYGMPIVAAIRRLTELPLDVHLMIRQPEQYVSAFLEAGADNLTVHVEATSDPRGLLTQIRALGAGAGIALNPGTPLATLEPCLDVADLVLVMSVEAGFGGQKFNDNSLARLRELRPKIRPEVLLEIDGGINDTTISRAAQSGAQLFVVGSAIFGQPRYAAAVSELTRLAADASVAGGQSAGRPVLP
jgi:ribulose-phosphate 3-epimerase